MLTLLRKRQQCRDVFWLKRGCRCVCGSCTLAVLVGCGLSSGLFMFLSFFSFTVASLQGVAQDSMLSCNHCLTLSLLSVIFSVLLKPPAASTALQPPLPPPVNLCRGSASLSFSGVILCLLFGWLAFFYLFILVVRHPAARRALSHGSVLRLFTVLWLVSGSQSCSCEAVSVDSMLWLVFRVDHVHKAPQLPGLTPTHPHIQSV